MIRVGDTIIAPETGGFVTITHLANSFFCGMTEERIPTHVIFVNELLANHPDTKEYYRTLYTAHRNINDIVIFRENLWSNLQVVRSYIMQNLVKESLDKYKEELMAKSCHPSRYFEWCLATDDLV